MTVRELLGVMLRRWYVVVAVFLGVGLFAASSISAGGVYATRTVIAFVAPGDYTGPFDTDGSTQKGAIAFAASVARVINDGEEPPRYATTEAPYYGAGIREGVLVSLPSTGGQWSVSYPRAAIELQIVGPTPAWVETRQRALLDRVAELTRSQQEAMRIAPRARFQTTVEPVTTEIYHVGSGRLTTIAALAALGTVALLVGGWCAVAVDDLLPARRRAPQRNRTWIRKEVTA